MMEQKPTADPIQGSPIERDSSVLHKTDAIWRGILQFSLDGIILVRKDGTIEEANEFAANQLDRHGESLIGEDYFRLLPPGIQRKRREQIDLAFSSAQALYWEDEWNQRFFLNTAFLVKEGESVVVMSRESTELKIQEESAQNKRARLQTLIETIPDLIWLKDTAGRYVNCNPKFELLAGASEADIKGKTDFDFLPREQAEAFREDAEAAIRTGQEVVSRRWVTFACDSHKEFVEIINTPFLDGYGILKGVMGVARDVTPFNRTEEELRYWNSLYRALVDLSLDGILIVDKDGKIVMYNKKFVDIWGVAEEMLKPEATGERRLQWFVSQIENPETFLARIQFLHANPSEAGFDEIAFKNGRRVERYSVGIVDEGSVSHGRIWYFRDVTERKQAEEMQLRLTAQLHQSQKMDALGQLAGGVAHDVNNALAVIVGAAELLLDGRKTEEARDKFTKMILQASERAGNLTKKLLAFARKSPGETRPVDMKIVIEDTAAILGHTIDRNIQVIVDDRASATTVIGDDALLQNLILNLGINASQAMPSGGTITFILDNIELDKDYCHMAQFNIEPGQYLQIAVRDTGSGISPESLPRIFEPFFTTKDRGKGTGLGLAVVYGAVQKHRGAITVYSHVGDGTVFHVYLPLSEKSAMPYIEAVAPAGTGTILVIDDDELIRATTRTMLGDLGYEVFDASNGVDAIKVLNELTIQIDLALVDMVMPLMSGREVINEIHKLDKEIPIIVSSGFSKEGEWAELKACGAVAFLRKPFRRAELARVIAEAIR